MTYSSSSSLISPSLSLSSSLLTFFLARFGATCARPRFLGLAAPAGERDRPRSSGIGSEADWGEAFLRGEAEEDDLEFLLGEIWSGVMERLRLREREREREREEAREDAGEWDAIERSSAPPASSRSSSSRKDIV